MDKIPKPITFNPYKHHLHFLLNKIEQWKTTNRTNFEKELLLTGDNLLDFYTGKLTVGEICNECLDILNRLKILDSKSFLAWLQPNQYRKISISDTSEWVVKLSLDPECFIHIHPAKHSPFTIRVRATTLKTVLALKTNCVLLQNDMKKNLQEVNEARTKFLFLSPVKTLVPQKGILKLWKLFENES